MLVRKFNRTRYYIPRKNQPYRGSLTPPYSIVFGLTF